MNLFGVKSSIKHVVNQVDDTKKKVDATIDETNKNIKRVVNQIDDTKKKVDDAIATTTARVNATLDNVDGAAKTFAKLEIAKTAGIIVCAVCCVIMVFKK